MTPSSKCYDIIRSFEGLRLQAYKDPGSQDGLPITIGYGTTIYPEGKKVQLGDVITKERADECLKFEVDKKALSVDSVTKELSLNQNQFDSLTSFAYNCGIGALQKSTLLKKVKANKNDPTIEQEFLKWNKAGGHVMSGLTKRRQKEADLYFS